ncbi:LytTR family DNA-binding domain-containing protein, partial [Breznakia sp. OttesenSCG-928-G09]|nr:LytTR family DNA-binding domain-containing protein [Breznakia sp. OttesenSCG-928-G09]
RGILEREYDLYFLDIDMPNLNGFELATKIQEQYPNTILLFVSNHNEFVYDSFKFDAFFFVRKDHFESDMKDALKLANEKLLRKEKRYILENKGDKRTIPYNDILYFEKLKNKIRIKTMNHGDFYELQSMKGLQQKINLKELGFCLISAGTCVNLNSIVRLNGNDVFLKGDISLIASRRYLPELKHEYQKHLMESDT